MSYEPELQLEMSKNTRPSPRHNPTTRYTYGSLGKWERSLEGKLTVEGKKNAIDSIGLPSFIKGNPRLGCTCTEAYLHSVGEIVDGQIEADYMCHAGWHNYVVFKIFTKDTDKAQQVHIDHEGNLVDGQSFVAGSLEEL